ncbi:LamG domain-containing protein, partial [Patescibacteria group bacterium]|nr:LamG domain-containing protein [Patescibacteria group bacterium]
ALSFDGIGDYVDCGNKASLKISPTITIALWVKTSEAKNAYILRKAHAGTTWNLDWAFYQLGSPFSWHIQFATTVSQTNSLAILNNPALDTWYHVVLVIDTDTGKVKRYVNAGTPQESGVSGILLLSDQNLYLATGGTFNGSIDELRIYNKALSSAEIQKHYAEGLEKHNGLAQK